MSSAARRQNRNCFVRFELDDEEKKNDGGGNRSTTPPIERETEANHYASLSLSLSLLHLLLTSPSAESFRYLGVALVTPGVKGGTRG